MHRIIGKFAAVPTFDIWSLIAAVCGFIVSYYTPVAPFVFFTIALIVADALFAIKANMVQNRRLPEKERKKNVVESKKMQATSDKFLVYLAIFALVYPVQKMYMMGVPIVHPVAFWIMFTEMKSLSESWEIILGQDIWTWLGELIKRKQKK